MFTRVCVCVCVCVESVCSSLLPPALFLVNEEPSHPFFCTTQDTHIHTHTHTHTPLKKQTHATGGLFKTILYSDSDYSRVQARVGPITGPADVAKAKELLKGFKVTPLTDFLEGQIGDIVSEEGGGGRERECVCVCVCTALTDFRPDGLPRGADWGHRE